MAKQVTQTHQIVGYLNQTTKMAAKRAKELSTLCEWLACPSLWQLPLKDGVIIVFSDNESTVLTFYVKWSARKLGSLRLAASRFGFLLQNPLCHVVAGQSNHLHFQVFAYFRSGFTRSQVADLMLKSNPVRPLKPCQEMHVENQFEFYVKMDQ